MSLKIIMKTLYITLGWKYFVQFEISSKKFSANVEFCKMDPRRTFVFITAKISNESFYVATWEQFFKGG
jgi:hypothetical protein